MIIDPINVLLGTVLVAVGFLILRWLYQSAIWWWRNQVIPRAKAAAEAQQDYEGEEEEEEEEEVVAPVKTFRKKTVASKRFR
jgi:hypothetical protein